LIDIEELGVDFFRQLAGQTPAGICVLDSQGGYLFVNQAFETITGLSSERLSSGPSLFFFAPREREEVQKELAAVQFQQRRRWGTRVLRPTGEHRDVEAIAIGVTIAGQMATALVLFDVTDTLRLALKVSTINAFAHSLSMPGSIQQLLDQLSASLVESTEAIASIVLLLEPGPSRVVLAGTSGIPESLRSWNLLPGDPVLEVFESGKAKVIGDFGRQESGRDLLGRLAPALGLGSAILVPLRTSERTLGVAICTYSEGREPDQAEVTFVNTLVGLAAVAVDHARLVQLAQRQAVTEERARLGRELHDSVSQTLYGIGLGAQSALEALNADPGEAAESINYILKLASGGLTEMRTLLYKLRPESLAAEGLLEALRQHAGALGDRHKIVIVFECGEEPNLPMSSKHAIYRMVMEAVHNAVKHAQAASLRVSLEQRGQQFTITVADDGQGFDVHKGYCGHHGLDSMRERIGSLGGELTLESRPGLGTVVRATVPIPVKTL
jgi:PAS domain S-box-containing protein